MTGNVHLRGMTWGHTRGFAPLAALGRVWEDFNPGQKITWEDRSLRAFGEEPLERYAQTHDLIVFDYPHAGGALENGWVLPLDGLIAPDVLAERSAGTIGPGFEAFRYRGRLAAILIDMATHVSVSRPDLLDQMPQSWDQVLDLARSTGRVAMPMRPTGVWGAFLSICANAGAAAFATPGTAFDPDVAARALNMLRNLAELVDPACFGEYPVALLNRMATGNGVAYMPFTYGYATYSIAGYAPHRLAFGDLPLGRRGGAVMGGAGIGILAGCRDPDLAARHIAWLTAPEVQRGLYAFCGGQPAQRAAWDDPMADAHAGGFFSATRAAAETAYLRPNTPVFHHFQNHAAGLLHDAVCGREPAGTALSAINEAWRAANAQVAS